MNAPTPFGRLGNRASSRLAAGLEVIFQTSAQTCRVTIHDISRLGARIETPPLAMQRAEGVLRVGGLALLCDLVWSRRGLSGLKFYKPLNEGQMQALRSAVEADRAGGLAGLADASHVWR